MARDKTLANASDQSILARSLLKLEDRHSQDYSLDRVKRVKCGSLSPGVVLCFKKVVPGRKIADTQQYKALEDLALAANRWNQLKRSINVEMGRKLMRELGSRNNEIANALKTGLSKTNLRMHPAENLRFHRVIHVKDLLVQVI